MYIFDVNKHLLDCFKCLIQGVPKVTQPMSVVIMNASTRTTLAPFLKPISAFSKSCMGLILDPIKKISVTALPLAIGPKQKN